MQGCNVAGTHIFPASVVTLMALKTSTSNSPEKFSPLSTSSTVGPRPRQLSSFTCPGGIHCCCTIDGADGV